MDLSACDICPRLCIADRLAGDVGICLCSEEIRLARAALHFWEEPSISGEKGSGTVFFSGCPLHCVYCQNEPISRAEIGRAVSVERLAEIFFELRDKGAHNINLVTPTQYAPQIIEAIDLVRKTGFDLPFAYNTSGYERLETIAALEGYIDIFLTDFKYADKQAAARYSKAADYPQVANAALDAMFEAVGPYTSDEEGILRRGVIVRHMMLPGWLDDSMQVMDILADKPYIDDICVSIMNQYTPMPACAREYPELSAPVDADEYACLIDYALDLGISRSFMQEGAASSESFIPSFDYEGV